MNEQIQVPRTEARPLDQVMKEVTDAVQLARNSQQNAEISVKDLRWAFDQVSAKMNQAIYNDQQDQIHESCLKTIAVLVEILARS